MGAHTQCSLPGVGRLVAVVPGAQGGGQEGAQRPSLPAAEHRVRFQVQLEDVEVSEREDAVLECHVPLETIPTAWFLEDRELQPSHKYVMEDHGVVRRLTIRDARTDDDGIYLCQMKDKGRSIAEVSVRGDRFPPPPPLSQPCSLLSGQPSPLPSVLTRLFS